MHIYDVYSIFPIEPVTARGCWLWDANGECYLDFYGGHAVISIGHGHPEYVSRLSEQLKRISFYSNSVRNSLQQQLAEKLEHVSGISGYDLFLVNSGAEANENALKLASFANGRTSVLALENSFHGRTSAAINVTHAGQRYAAPLNKGFDVAFYPVDNITPLLEAIYNTNAAAVILETIQGVGGLKEISPENLIAIREACTKTDTILIADEVQCGYGRTGDFFAFQRSGIRPDIITVAKGMGNGFPIGGLLIDIDKIPAVNGRLGTTFGGNHLACTAAIAVLDIMEKEDLIYNARKQGNRILKKLKNLPGVQSTKGRGLMIGAEMSFPIASLRENLVMEQKVITGNSADPLMLRILPPLCIKKKTVKTFISRMKRSLEALSVEPSLTLSK